MRIRSFLLACLLVTSFGNPVLLGPSISSAFAQTTPPKVGKTQRELRRLAMRSSRLMRLVYRIRYAKSQRQVETARQLRALKETRSIPYLLGMLHMPEAHLRRGGIVSLGQMGLSWSGDAIAHLLKDKNKAVRTAALLHASRNPSRQGAMHLAAWLRQARGGEAKRVLTALALADHPGTLAALQSQRARLATLPGLKTALSLTLANLGDVAERKRWKARIQQGKAVPLAKWPGTWGTQQVLRTLNKAPASQRAALLRGLLQRRIPRRARALQRACRTKAVPKSACRAFRPYIRHYQTGFAALPRPMFLQSKPANRRLLKTIHTQGHPFYKRLQLLSTRMMGTPYVLDALGEGKKGKYDNDPIFTLKKMDCVTFLEQLIALSTQTSYRKAVQYTQQLRYIHGKIGYPNRKHFPMTQWIPLLIKQGVVKDITRAVGGAQTRHVSKNITRASYRSKVFRQFVQRIGQNRLVTGKFRFPYIRLSTAVKQIKRIPEGSILSMLRVRPTSAPGQIFHQGLVVKLKGKKYFRHATKVWGGVVDTPLKWYLESLIRYRRPVLGIHVLRIQPNAKATALR